MKTLKSFLVALLALAALPAYAQEIERSRTISFNTIADLELLDFDRFSDGAAIFIADEGRNGFWKKISTNETALRTDDATKGVFIPDPDDASGAQGGFIREEFAKNRSLVNVRWFGAKGDFNTGTQTGTLDDNAFTAAKNVGTIVYVPDGNFRINGYSMVGAGSVLIGASPTTSILYIDSLTGCGVTMTSIVQRIENIAIDATTARYGDPNPDDGRDLTTNSGVCTQDLTTAPGGAIGTRTQGVIKNAIIRYHPGEGIYCACNMMRIEDSIINYNRRAGIRIDDGTGGGFTTKVRSGIVNLVKNLIVENGGPGVAIGEGTSTAYRVTMLNNELFGNAWNYPDTGNVNTEIYLRAQNTLILGGAAGDPYFANTLMSDGVTERLAKGAAGDAIELNASSNSTEISTFRYISVSRPIDDKGSTGLVVDQMYIEPATTYGVYLAGTTGVDITMASTAGYSTGPVTHTTADEVFGGKLRVGVNEYWLLGSSGTFHINGKTTSTISASSANIASTVTGFNPGAPTNLQSINFGGGSLQMPDGLILTFINESANAITLKDALTNVETPNNADFILGGGEMVTATTAGGKVWINGN